MNKKQQQNKYKKLENTNNKKNWEIKKLIQKKILMN